MISMEFEHDLKASVRTIPDYPKPGIMFRDITTLLGNARAFRRAVDELVQPWAGSKIDKVAGIEARGFILGGAVAHQVSAGFVPIRKKGKLPFKRVTIGYSLEYGIDEMEMHEDAVLSGERVILVAEDAGHDVGCAAGSIRHDDLHRLRRIFVLRRSGDGAERQAQQRQTKTEPSHHVLPLNSFFIAAPPEGGRLPIDCSPCPAAETGNRPRDLVALFLPLPACSRRWAAQAALMPCRLCEASLQVKNTTSPSGVALPECTALEGT